MSLRRTPVSRSQAPHSPPKGIVQMSPLGIEPRILPLRAGAFSARYLLPTNPLGDPWPPPPTFTYLLVHLSLPYNWLFLLLFHCFECRNWYIGAASCKDVVMLPKFNRRAQACRKKFIQIFGSYKEDKFANGISSNNRQESKIFDVLDQWYHQAG